MSRVPFAAELLAFYTGAFISLAVCTAIVYGAWGWALIDLFVACVAGVAWWATRRGYI